MRPASSPRTTEVQDQVIRFLEARTVRGSGNTVQVIYLYVAYLEWSSENETPPLLMREFRNTLLEMGFTVEQPPEDGSRPVWTGIALLPKREVTV